MSLSNNNREFIAFLISETGQNIMKNNSLTLHIESGNIFYQNFNTNENFYNFLLAQQDETKAIVLKRISYHNSFKRYSQNFLPSFSIDDVEKLDLYVIKTRNIFFIDLMIKLMLQGEKDKLFDTLYKDKRLVGMKKN